MVSVVSVVIIDLADMCKNVTKVPYNNETLYNVLLEKHSKMVVNSEGWIELVSLRSTAPQ